MRDAAGNSSSGALIRHGDFAKLPRHAAATRDASDASKQRAPRRQDQTPAIGADVAGAPNGCRHSSTDQPMVLRSPAHRDTRLRRRISPNSAQAPETRVVDAINGVITGEF
jgi:hypothetical protein